MMGFDAASAAANLAALQARVDGGQFATSVVSTTVPQRPSHPLQRHFLPVTQSLVLVSWTATYKGRVYGDGFVTDATRQTEATNAILQYAMDVLNQKDVQRSTFGRNDSFPKPDRADGVPALQTPWPVAWLDPAYVDGSTGVVKSAVNRAAPNGIPWLPRGAAPLWGSNVFGGKPGFVWPGDVVRRLFTPIVPTFGGKPPQTGFTSIAVVQNGTPLNSGQRIVLATYLDSDIKSGYQVLAQNLASAYKLGVARFDETGLSDLLQPTAGLALACVLSTMFDGTTYTLRVNGVVIATSLTVSTGIMNAQDYVILGGASDASGAGSGFVGEMGSLVLFNNALRNVDLLAWERTIGAASGIIF